MLGKISPALLKHVGRLPAAHVDGDEEVRLAVSVHFPNLFRPGNDETEPKRCAESLSQGKCCRLELNSNHRGLSVGPDLLYSIPTVIPVQTHAPSELNHTHLHTNTSYLCITNLICWTFSFELGVSQLPAGVCWEFKPPSYGQTLWKMDAQCQIKKGNAMILPRR